MECDQIEYKVPIDWEGENTKIGFQPVPPQLIDINSCQVEAGPIQPLVPNLALDQTSVPQILTFKTKTGWLPFQLDIGKEANLICKQQSWFINLVYENKGVFSLHDEDLSYCDQIKHIILTTTYKPVYLPCCKIHRQLQSKVCKCLGTWLFQGIIQPSKAHIHHR